MFKESKGLLAKIISGLLVIIMLATSSIISPSVYAKDFSCDNIDTEIDIATFSEELSDIEISEDEQKDGGTEEIITGDGEVSDGITATVSSVEKRREGLTYLYDCTVTLHTISSAGDATVVNESNFSSFYTILTENNGQIYPGANMAIKDIKGTAADNTVVIEFDDIFANISNPGLSCISVFYKADTVGWIDVYNPESYLYKEDVSLAINDVKLTEEAFEENTLDDDHGLVVMFNSDDVSATLDVDYAFIHYAGDKIAQTDGNYYYTGKQVKPNINVFDGNVKLVDGKDYKIVYKNCIKPYVDDKLTEKYGTGWSTKETVNKAVKNPYALITGVGSYKGVSIAKFYNIVPAQIGYGYGIRAVATIKNSRIVPGKKPVAPKVDVTIQKWNEDKGKYFKISTLKQGRDYKVTYRKVGDAKEVSSISGNDIAGSYFAVVSGAALSDNSNNGGKLETAAQSMARAEIPDDYNYKHLVPFVINDRDKDLSKASIKLKTGKESLSYFDITSIRSEQGLEAGQILSDSIEVVLNNQTIDSSYYKVYVANGFCSVGKNRPLEVVPTTAGEKEGYFGKYTKNENGAKNSVVLNSQFEITGRNVNDYKLFNYYIDGEIKGETAEFVQKNNDYLVTPNKLAGAFEFRNADNSEYLTNTPDNDGDYTVNFIKTNSGVLGEGKYELVGNPLKGYTGKRDITIKIVPENGGLIALNDYALCIKEEREYAPGEYAEYAVFLDNQELKPQNPVIFDKNVESKGVDFSLSIQVNGIDREIVKDKDYTLEYTTNNDTKTGDAVGVIHFIGKYEGIEDYKVLFKINPMADAANINAIIKNISIKGEISLENLLKKAKYSIFEKSTGKTLVLDEDFEIDNKLYEGLSKTVVSDMSAIAEPEKIYYMRFAGKPGSGYEGLSVYRALKFNRKLTSTDFKNAFKNVKIAHKGDISYLERGDFLDKLQIEGLGEFGENKDFYFIPYKKDIHGNPDAAYYGSVGKKKVYIVGSEYTNKCSGSILVTIKVDTIDKDIKKLEDGGYQYIRSLPL